MKLIRKRMIRFKILLKLNDGGTDDDNSPRCAHRRGCLTVAQPSLALKIDFFFIDKERRLSR